MLMTTSRGGCPAATPIFAARSACRLARPFWPLGVPLPFPALRPLPLACPLTLALVGGAGRAAAEASVLRWASGEEAGAAPCAAPLLGRSGLTTGGGSAARLGRSARSPAPAGTR